MDTSMDTVMIHEADEDAEQSQHLERPHRAIAHKDSAQPASLGSSETPSDRAATPQSTLVSGEESSQPTDQQGTSNEDSSWTGWAELENDPIIFGTLLREWGVTGVEVREVVPLDAIFTVPATSVFGLIFLSRYTAPTQAASSDPIPAELWFANQTASYSCASVALMNIINNRMEIDLGEIMQNFKTSTINMSAKDRGLMLDKYDHVRNVHNSFATHIDKLNVDMRLKESAAAAQAKKRSKKAKKGGRRQKKRFTEDEEESGFHFIAYVPACGRVWKLDGLERSPRSLGSVSGEGDWVTVVVADVQAQMESAAAANELEFSLLSLGAESDSSEHTQEAERMRRVREDWGPMIAQFIRVHAEKGDLAEMLQ